MIWTKKTFIRIKIPPFQFAPQMHWKSITCTAQTSKLWRGAFCRALWRALWSHRIAQQNLYKSTRFCDGRVHVHRNFWRLWNSPWSAFNIEKIFSTRWELDLDYVSVPRKIFHGQCRKQHHRWGGEVTCAYSKTNYSNKIWRSTEISLE